MHGQSNFISIKNAWLGFPSNLSRHWVKLLLLFCGFHPFSGVMESSEELDSECIDKLAQLKKYYLAIEVDPTMTREEKIPFMEEWWDKAHAITINSSLTRSGIHKAVTNSNLYLR